ncbi:MAG: DUF4407 domain-containing protein [Flavobacterium sp.]|nr:MAG: DUF4407 domain-containing protein [Flavobacterium sp.]
MIANQSPHKSIKVYLSIFSGEDKEYVRQSARKARIIFAWIGLLVITIFVGCFLSAYSFFDSLFQSQKFISIPIGVGWGLLVVNMYLLLLYTVSPTILPHKKNKGGTENRFLNFSMLCRMAFMSLLAIIIAQPINVELFSHTINPSLQRYVQEERTRMIITSNTFIILSCLNMAMT